jgi:hypothetical protein
MAGLIALVGSYGSGKTELAVNLALQLARDRHVQLADLDLVNPYFRCREARTLLESRGIRVVVPPGAQAGPTSRSSCRKSAPAASRPPASRRCSTSAATTSAPARWRRCAQASTTASTSCGR